MLLFSNQVEALRDFFESGGWVILVVAIILWSLIIERYWYVYITYPAYADSLSRKWNGRVDKHSWYARQIREAWVSDVSSRLKGSLSYIGTLISICPLLGLLGTVTGMIHVFDVMAATGTGNARAMASGVSLATIPTMAGMVIALSALYFRMHLNQKAEFEIRKLADEFSE
jgi:biopolymer transport protein ExbB